jgi:hypothetical protein
MTMKILSALTPALFARSGGAVVSSRLIRSRAAFCVFPSAARDSAPDKIEVAFPLLGERAGVRASVLSIISAALLQCLSLRRFALAQSAWFAL